MVNIDRQIAIYAGWIAGPAFGIAMMAAPDYLHLSPVASALCFWGGIGVFVVTVAVVAILSAHEQERRHRVMGPVIMMVVGAVIFLGGTAWYFWPSRGELKEASYIKITIQDVIFDANGPTELYVDFKLSNLGPPSTVENWNLDVLRNGELLWSRAPRVTFQMTADPSAPRGYRPPRDLLRDPMATGEQLTPHFTWTYDGNAKERFGYPGTVFVLTGTDIRGHEIKGTYAIK